MHKKPNPHWDTDISDQTIKKYTRKRFLIFRSGNTIESLVGITLMPFFTIYLAWWSKEGGDFLLYFVLPLLLNCQVYIYYRFLANVTFNEHGVCCHRLFRKPMIVPWEKVVRHGTFYRGIVDSTLKFYYFSSMITTHMDLIKTMPDLSPDMIFVTDSPKIEAIAAYFLD